MLTGLGGRSHRSNEMAERRAILDGMTAAIRKGTGSPNLGASRG